MKRTDILAGAPHQYVTEEWRVNSAGFLTDPVYLATQPDFNLGPNAKRMQNTYLVWGTTYSLSA